MGLGPEDYEVMGHTSESEVMYHMWLTNETVEELKKLPYVTKVDEEHLSETSRVFPYAEYYGYNEYIPDSLKKFQWSADNFGPLWIPKEGATIDINASTLALYGFAIKKYDHNDDVKIENGKLIIDGKEVTTYTFKQNYYFMMGDNRHNSLDSRYWGFVPEDHIVGKAFFIWLSIDKNADFLHKIRWSRFFNLIR